MGVKPCVCGIVCLIALAKWRPPWTLWVVALCIAGAGSVAPRTVLSTHTCMAVAPCTVHGLRMQEGGALVFVKVDALVCPLVAATCRLSPIL